MADRELIEQAAQTAGIRGSWARTHQTYGDMWVDGLDCGGPILWNPLAAYEPREPDPHAAVRRAITRAAAAHQFPSPAEAHPNA